MLPGIDVSHYQGKIDWAKVKAAGIQFAYLKATQGASFVDPMLAVNYAGATSVGIPVGLYHVFLANTGVAQLTNWLTTWRKYPPQLTSWLDIEPGAVTEDTLPQVLDLLHDGFGSRNCVYCSPSTADQCAFPEFSYSLAIAHYGVPEPRVPKPWTDWVFWQHDAVGSVDGISSSVDLDWFNGESLQKILRTT